MKAPSKDVSRSSPARASAHKGKAVAAKGRKSRVSEAKHGAPAPGRTVAPKKNSTATKRPAVAAPKKMVVAEHMAAPKEASAPVAAPIAAPAPVTAFSPQMIRARIGKVCVAIIGATPAEMVEKATEAVRENTFLEFRLDYLPNPLAAIPKLKQFLSERSEVTAIATCRRASTGGKFKGTIAAELEVLEKASGAGFHLIDVELQTAEAMKRAQMEELRSYGAALIISYHDFEMTKDLDRTFERIRPFEPEFIKVVSTAKHLADNVTMMRFLERTRDLASVIGIVMGEQGIISRVLGLRAGSVFTFAAATLGEETGPGQIAARTLRETYRIDQLDAATKVYGVAGNPIKHSLSPLMMNAAFRRETVNGVFLALQASRLTDLLTLVREVPISGLAVTMPLKEEILKHLERTDPLSEKVGACNTVVRSADGKLYGFNTDVAAVVRPLERRLPLKGARVLVMGAGGGVRAEGQGRRSVCDEPHAGGRPEAGASGEGEDLQARAADENEL